MEIVIDAFFDTLKAFPFLLGACLLLEWLAHRAGEKPKLRLKKFGRLGSLGGAVLGLVPQCGFSVAAAKFYADRIITPGTLAAVFISTSDEAIPILMSPEGAKLIIPLVAIKIALAVAAGFFVDFALSSFWRPVWERDSELRHEHLEGHAHRHADGSVDTDEGHCHHGHCEGGIFHTALSRALRVSFVIFTITLVLGFALEHLGEDRTASLLLRGSPLQPVAAALFGLIPNCAASVFLADLHIQGAITFGSMVAGLSTGAGVGTLVLVQACGGKREAFLVLAFIFLVGAAAGLAVDAVV